MFQATELVYEALLRRGRQVQDPGGRAACRWWRSGFRGRNFAERAACIFLSNAEGNDVAVRAANLVKFPPERLDKLYAACNDVNRRYRFAKFVVDPAKDVVNMELDIPSRCENVGAVAEEMLVRAPCASSTRSTPRLMQATWA